MWHSLEPVLAPAGALPAGVGYSPAPTGPANDDEEDTEEEIMADSIRVLLVDDHAVLRGGLKALLDLEPDMEVVGEASTGEEGVDRVRALRPDIVVMDLGLPGMDGLEATRQIVALERGTRILVLTSHAEEEYLLPVLEAGASGYVHKTSADEDLIAALRVVARGEVFLYPNATKILLRGYRHAEARGEASPVEALSDREREVLALTSEGYSSKEIARKLFLSPKTVDTYRSRLMRKLGLSHRADLVQFALRTGLLKAKQEAPAPDARGTSSTRPAR